MLKINECITPSPEQFELVIKGMRLPMKSGDRSDSGLCGTGNCDKCSDRKQCWNYKDDYAYPYFHLGDEDKQLLFNLCKAGDPSHRKVLRQLPIITDITAPEYFWRQLDQYKISTVTNSTSQMHTLLKKPFELSDFSLEIFEYRDVDYDSGGVIEEYNDVVEVESWIDHLNYLRDEYLLNGRKEAWYRILERIPQSFNYTRCWSGNYETLVNIINQRSNHKLSEWHTFCEYMLENVPYLKEIVEAVNGNRS